jgi:hypothetical protein
MGAEIFLWIAIISSGVFLFGYEIWNLIVVSVWFSKMSKEKRTIAG